MYTQASKEFKVQSSNQPIQGTILFYPWLVRERRGSGYRNKRGGCVAKSKRGLKCILFTVNACIQYTYTVPENSGMSAEMA